MEPFDLGSIDKVTHLLSRREPAPSQGAHELAGAFTSITSNFKYKNTQDALKVELKGSHCQWQLHPKLIRVHWPWSLLDICGLLCKRSDVFMIRDLYAGHPI